MTIEITDWLRKLGLEQYAPAFRDNAVDSTVLPRLTAEDLKDLGVIMIGHRRRLLDAIAALSDERSAGALEPASGEASQSTDAERRQVTVMFCDLVGSTALSTRFDPEDLQGLIGAYQRAVTLAVSKFGGFVAKYMGDGVLVYFGYPRAHEDDAERAVRAGLRAIEAVSDLEPVKLEARIGIASGAVVVGDLIGKGSSQEQSIVGETPNLAARLQALAAPGALVIAANTRQQIGQLFELEDLGWKQLAGFGEPQLAWRVLGESPEIGRFAALRSGRSPLLGRDEEVELLMRRWNQAKSGEGRGADFRRTGHRQVTAHRCAVGAYRKRASHALASFLLALLPGQRPSSIHCPARTRRGVRPGRHRRRQDRQASSAACARHTR
jgi:class 3 adenylate cyclase